VVLHAKRTEKVKASVHNPAPSVKTSSENDKYTPLCVYRRTVDFCRQVESAGVSFLTVHSRTKKQRCEPVNLEATKLIKDSLSIPVVHNGDVCSLDDVLRISETTGADGECYQVYMCIPIGFPNTSLEIPLKSSHSYL